MKQGRSVKGEGDNSEGGRGWSDGGSGVSGTEVESKSQMYTRCLATKQAGRGRMNSYHLFCCEGLSLEELSICWE